ncbi:MAG TPA: hypothetical protein P5328_02285 [Candidatus Paceibacterota bacterium]|nr:hypothetical protein [Candidatus Paceibacterota bacterium]HRZ34419.1 hypothetical protein [Candidatus Paceibacterota bacterium]
MREIREKPSLLILGVSGGVAGAFLQIFRQYRNNFSEVILLDKDDKILRSGQIDLVRDKYSFINQDIVLQNIELVLADIKHKHDISIVLDLTDCETFPILQAADKLGLSYLNCSLNNGDESMKNFVRDYKSFTQKFKNNAHLLSIGMNPGIINHLVVRGVLEYGIPKEFVEIEYETGFPEKDVGRPFITWSRKQFLLESVLSGSGYCGSGGKYVESKSSAIEHPIKTEEFLSPIKKFDSYPLGMIVPHDEIISMSRIIEVPGRFVYAIHPVSLSRLREIFNKKGNVVESDIDLLDGVTKKLIGSDLIGVWLFYDDKKICYFCEVNHKDVSGTNATLFLVAVGVLAALMDFISNPLLENGVSFVNELNSKNFQRFVSRYVKINKIEVKK